MLATDLKHLVLVWIILVTAFSDPLVQYLVFYYWTSPAILIPFLEQARMQLNHLGAQNELECILHI